eukprot:945597-Ditylum_brightwellii.AAC.1
MEWDDKTDIEEKKQDEEGSTTTQQGRTSTNKHEFYRFVVEIGQDRIIQCRNGNNLDLEITDEAAASYREQKGITTDLKETPTIRQRRQLNKFGTNITLEH